MVTLGSHCSRGGLGQIGVGLQGFVKHLHSPPFFVARNDSVIVACQVAAHQVQNSRAVVLVSKDLAVKFRAIMYPVAWPLFRARALLQAVTASFKSEKQP